MDVMDITDRALTPRRTHHPLRPSRAVPFRAAPRWLVPAALLAAFAAAAAAACTGADGGAAKAPVPAISSVASGQDAPGSQRLASAVTSTGMQIAGGDTLSDSLLIARADRGRILGAENGTIWMVVISDFQCPYCKMWHDSTNTAVKRDYVDKGLVRLAYINLPLPQHKHARVEAEAAMCASAQSKFWEFSAGLFHEQHAVEKLATIEPLLDSLARANALDVAEFGRCRRTNIVKQIVDSDIQQAQRMNVRSTPTFLVGEFLVEGVSSYPDFRRVIDTAIVVARNKKSGAK